MLGIYFIASLIMKPQPVNPLKSDEEKDFYDNYVSSRQGAIRTLKSRFDALDRRIRRMEETVTAREFDWDRRFNAS
jgi:phage shock protein C